MIKVEMTERVEGVDGHVVTGTLTVDDHGKAHFEGDRAAFPTDLPALLADDDGGFRRVGFEDDPATWARHLHTILRTGYVVPVIVADTAAQSRS